MPHSPPAEFVELLERLGLATSGQIASVAPVVRRLAGELPPFESVWIDALAQRRLLTPYQASQLITGHGEALQIGPYIVRSKLSSPAWAEAFHAVHRETGESAELLVVRRCVSERTNLLASIEKLIQQIRLLHEPRLLCPMAAGQCNHGIWV